VICSGAGEEEERASISSSVGLIIGKVFWQANGMLSAIWWHECAWKEVSGKREVERRHVAAFIARIGG
jgi:hypothetical protein